MTLLKCRRGWIFTWLAALLIAESSCSSAEKPAPETQAVSASAPVSGVIEGVVRRPDTSQPIERATVELFTFRESESVWAPTTIPPVQTDVEGRFRFPNVPSDRYMASAWKVGFWGPLDFYPESRQQGSVRQRVIPDADGNSRSLVFELLPGANFRGRILQPNGSPAVGVTVTAARLAYEKGRRTLTRVWDQRTDANGEYALLGLQRGEYYIRAAVTPPPADVWLAPPTYFPGTIDEARAMPVPVDAGDVGNVSLTLIEPPAPAFTISGAIRGSIPGIASGSLRLADRNDPVRNSDVANWASSQPQGLFLIRGVPPGAYDLFVTGTIEHDRRIFISRIPIDVVDGNVMGVKVDLLAGADPGGRLTLDGRQPTAEQIRQLACLDFRARDALGFGFRIIPFMKSDGRIRAGDIVSRVDPLTAEFTAEGVPAGIYGVSICQQPPVYLADVRQAGKSVIDTGFVVGQGTAEPIELIIRTDAGSIAGTVRDSKGNAVRGAIVALVPDVPRRKNWDLYASAVSGEEDGEFRFDQAIPPGEYTIFAWTKIPLGAWTNAEVLSRYEQRGQKVTVAPGASLTLSVEILPDAP